MTRKSDILHEDICTFMTISHWSLLRKRNISQEYSRENKKNYSQFIFPENHAVCEIMWKNLVQPDRPDGKIINGACALHAA